MRLRLIIVVFCQAILLVACNLGASTPTPRPLPSPTSPSFPPSGNKPSVVVTSPESGEQFAVNQTLVVDTIATDSVGVTRVQLFANGSPVKTVSSVSATGDTTLTASLDYTPRATGTVTLRVLAFRGQVSSDPVDLEVVIGTATQPTAIPQPDGGGSSDTVVIPQDGVCRVLTNTAVNFRSAPTTTQNNILFTLGASTLAPVVARLGDNTWWKINVNGRVGWVSAQFVTLTGNCFSVPIENIATSTPTATSTSLVPPTPTPTKTPSAPTNTPTPLSPDLIVTNIFGSTTITLGGATVSQNYSVTITNTGLGSAGQFSAVLSVNNGTGIDLGAVGSLEPGQSVVLQTSVSFSSAGTYNLRVDVDATNSVKEVSEINNRGDVTVTVSN